MQLEDLENKVAALLSALLFPPSILQGNGTIRKDATGRSINSKDLSSLVEEGRLLFAAETALKPLRGGDGYVSGPPPTFPLLQITGFQGRSIHAQIALLKRSGGDYALALFDSHPAAAQPYALLKDRLSSIASIPILTQVMGGPPFQYASSRTMELKALSFQTIGEFLTRLNAVLQPLGIAISGFQAGLLRAKHIHRVNELVVNHICRVLGSFDHGQNAKGKIAEVATRLKALARRGERILALSDMETLLSENGIGGMPEAKVKYLMNEVREMLAQSGVEVGTLVPLTTWNGRMHLCFSSRLPRFMPHDLERLSTIHNPDDIPFGPSMRLSITPDFSTPGAEVLTDQHTDYLAYEFYRTFGLPELAAPVSSGRVPQKE